MSSFKDIAYFFYLFTTGFAGTHPHPLMEVICKLYSTKCHSYINSVDYILTLLSNPPHHRKAPNSLIYADVPLRNYSLAHSYQWYMILSTCKRLISPLLYNKFDFDLIWWCNIYFNLLEARRITRCASSIRPVKWQFVTHVQRTCATSVRAGGQTRCSLIITS